MVLCRSGSRLGDHPSDRFESKRYAAQMYTLREQAVGARPKFMDMTEPARQVQGFGRGTGAQAEEGIGAPHRGSTVDSQGLGRVQSRKAVQLKREGVW